jgi:hypothetical protein
VRTDPGGVTETWRPVAGSFRDPGGFVFTRDGVLYRYVGDPHRTRYDLLQGSGLYGRLVESGLLIPHVEADIDLGPDGGGAYRILCPELVDFVSYPYEWCFSQLRDAALATLRVQSLAMDHGMSLRDASAYNVQFHRGRPTLIDTLSFEAVPDGRPWVAYRQFCQHFLAPLALMSYRDVRLGRLLRDHVDGIPLDLAVRLLPRRARLRPPLLLHLFLHARTQRRHLRDTGPAAKAPTMSARALRGLLDSLRNAIEGLKTPAASAGWGEYDEEAHHYDGRAREAKERAVEAFIDRVAPRSIWDLGANVGRFSRLGSSRGIPTVAFDLDAACVETTYRRVRDEREPNLLPLLLDLVNPSPAIGWANEERMTLAQRGPADLCLALALIHHLAIGNNVPLPRIAKFLAEVCRWAAVEFVPKSDVKVTQMLTSREDVFPHYSVEGFERALEPWFAIDRRVPVPGSERVLYLLRRRA